VTTITLPQAPEHWPKVMDIAKDGTIYITNGSTQGEVCTATNPPWGTILRLEVDGSATPIARGFRNPIALRCETNNNVCLAAELALDYSGNGQGGREKVVPVREGDDWGYPCCATKDRPFGNVLYANPDSGYPIEGGVPDCSGVASESEAFIIGETPFGIDFEPGNGNWPAPWGGRAFVTLHGEVSLWEGSRIVGVALDPTTGLPRTASDLNGAAWDSPAAIDFAKGWDDGRKDHGRPAAVTFAPDGRLFLGDDQAGRVVWIAPVGLKGP
jgi:glucose/arabinose dehydrogenase